MGRKMKLDGNCGSKFITIDDEKKWALIREIATVDRYKNSFNAIVNDALMFGLPELHRRLFDKVEIDGEEKTVSVPREYSEDALYFELVRLMRENIANQVVLKRLVCSIFNLLAVWGEGARMGEAFKKGFLKASLVMGGRNAVRRKFQERISERHAGLHRKGRSAAAERSGEVRT